MEQREKDIQKLCDTILSFGIDKYDNPYGGYESTCPFCGVKESRFDGDGIDIWASMQDLTHDQDCAYLIAKDLSTNLTTK